MKTEKFSLELIQAINDYQYKGYGNDKITLGNILKEQVKSLPLEFRTYNGVCYRKFNSDGNISLKLGLTEFLNEEYSSWTIDLDVAKSFGKEPNRKYTGILFKKDISDQSNVILNLNALYDDVDFLAAIESYRQRNQIKNIEEGIDKYINSQKEIILTKTNLSIDDIIAYYGKGKGMSEFLKCYFPEVSEREKQKIIQEIREKQPNIGKKRWVVEQEQINRLIIKHKIGSIILSSLS